MHVRLFPPLKLHDFFTNLVLKHRYVAIGRKPLHETSTQKSIMHAHNWTIIGQQGRLIIQRFSFFVFNIANQIKETTWERVWKTWFLHSLRDMWEKQIVPYESEGNTGCVIKNQMVIFCVKRLFYDFHPVDKYAKWFYWKFSYKKSTFVQFLFSFMVALDIVDQIFVRFPTALR